MNDRLARLARWEELPQEALNPLLSRRMISGERIMIAQLRLEAGAVVPTHSHENEQLTYVIDGLLRFWLGEDESQMIDVGAGEVLVIPCWLPHRVLALARTLDIDVFCPPRQDWLDGSDSYLREQ